MARARTLVFSEAGASIQDAKNSMTKFDNYDAEFNIVIDRLRHELPLQKQRSIFPRKDRRRASEVEVDICEEKKHICVGSVTMTWKRNRLL